MIPRREILMALGTSDMRHTALKNELCKYVNVCQAEVNEIISKGVTEAFEWLEPYVALILGLKKYIPEGFNPAVKKPVIKPRQLSFDKIYRIQKFDGKPLRRGKHWSEKELDTLRVMKKSQFTSAVMARALGRSEDAINTALTRKI